MLKSIYILRNMLRGKTYNEIGGMLTKGKITESELMKFYKAERNLAQRRERELIKAGIGGLNDLSFKKSANIVTTNDLVHEVADVNRYIKSNTTVSARKAEISKKLETMHKRGIFKNINESNFNLFARFMDWAKATSRFNNYSSESDVVEETIETVINTGADNSEQFETLFSAVVLGVI